MSTKSLGRRTIRFENPPVILSSASVAGKKEGDGPLRADFDIQNDDSFFGQETWEMAESEMQKLSLERAISKADLHAPDVNFVFAGDLLAQCSGSTFGLRDATIPFFGLYGACSTMAETLCVGAMAVDGGFADRVACLTSSHYCSAERQFRMPLEYGSLRTPTSQWTVTGAGCIILASPDCVDPALVESAFADSTRATHPHTAASQESSPKSGGVQNTPKITHFTAARIIDNGVTDANNMGAAMAPAAYDTLVTHFEETGRTPDYYDLILTGDLGQFGHDILVDFFARDGVKLTNYNDCGLMIFDLAEQDVDSGGSGCGCSATVLCGTILRKLRGGELRRVLFAATGAMLSATSSRQGESIPSICYAVSIET